MPRFPASLNNKGMRKNASLALCQRFYAGKIRGNSYWKMIASLRAAEYARKMEKGDLVRLKTGSAVMCVDSVDNDQSVVGGCIETPKVKDLEKLDHVRYVRRVFSYTADYPVGDPRDLDKCEDECGEDED